MGAGVLAGRLARGLTATTDDTDGARAASPSLRPEPVTLTAPAAGTGSGVPVSSGIGPTITDPVSGVTVYPAAGPQRTAVGGVTP